MNILYDYQIFDMQVAGGISRYHADLYKNCKLHDVNALLGLRYTKNIYIDKEGNFRRSFSSEDAFLGKINFRGKNLLYRTLVGAGIKFKNSWDLNAEYCRTIIASNKYEIFHPTYYNDLYSDVNIKGPIVLTIHDMIYESNPHFFGDYSIIENKRKLAERATAIIAISEFTKEEILRYYDFIDENKIHVVYHGISLDGIDESFYFKSKDNYLLYVGDRCYYKDFFTLLRAIKFLKRKGIDLKLITVGSLFNESESLYIDFLGLNNNVVNLGRVSDTMLRELYQKAMLYVSTSIAEGFGLPLLECMKYGTPMVLSDIPVYREIAGDAAVYFQSNDDNSLAFIISQVYGNSSILNELVDKGRKRILDFDIHSMINNTLNLYKTIVK